MIIGIDIGSTTTKAVAVENGVVIKTVKTKAFDAITSATGALGKIIIESNLTMSSIEKIIITGAGAISIKNEIFGIPTKKIDEINAIGIGGMFLSKKESVVIANIGTGTSIIEATREKITHLGGTGIGGGTITGLSKELLNATDFEHILEMAGKGDISQVDLLIEDISDSGISFLSGKSTASNFGKMLDTAEKEDMALGIINMVFQVIGVISVFAAKSRGASSVMVTGNGSKNLIGRAILEDISRLYTIRFEFPQDAEYATAIGAALSES
ncbi:MAG TPA: pantothenate kinase [Rikenellaceae bacterium]|nr:MAG: pantothenate kinase [Bacteroidetes bacterium GWE2_40_15]HBG23507.1 pantothenate kinase [Rikenellaceae bacterium]HBZ25441.1 pantothenate kinase [Rikenellaceae bacterium]